MAPSAGARRQRRIIAYERSHLEIVFIEGVGILGIIVGIAFLAVTYDAIANRRTLFSEPVTAQKRQSLLRLAVFGLLPLSILLHELGHAIAIWSIGREVLDFGFAFIYGFVSYNSFGVSPLQEAWIAVAGTLMNVLLGIVCLGIFWFRPQRPAVNYLLFIFTVIQGANALIFYPILDFAGGIVGDWSTIYSTETPLFSALIGVLHVGILGGAALTWKSPRFQRLYAERTGRVRVHRDVPARRSELAVIMARAASDAVESWKHPVELVTDAQAGGLQVILRWVSEGYFRRVLVHATPLDGPDPHVEFHAAIRAEEPGLPPYERPVMRINGRPNSTDLALHIRMALDLVESWDATNVTSYN